MEAQEALHFLLFWKLVGPAHLCAGPFRSRRYLTVASVPFAHAHRGEGWLPLSHSPKAQRDGHMGLAALHTTDKVKESDPVKSTRWQDW